MKVDKELVDKIAELAKLKFNDSDTGKIMTDLDKMLNFIDKLNELDTADVEPMEQVHDQPAQLREDETRQEISKEEALLNAPLSDQDFFKVPKVIRKK